MIYLIGGPPRSGKTILAKKICKKMGIPYFSIDSLEVVLTKNDLNEKKFPKTYLRSKQSFDKIFDNYTQKEIIKKYIDQGKYIEQFIETIIDREKWEGDNFILEGYQITPKFALKMKKKFGNKNIKAVFIAQTDKNFFLKNQEKAPEHNNWFKQKINKKKTIEKMTEMLCDYGKFFEKEAKKYGLNFIEINKNFNKKIDEIIKILTK